MNSTSQGHRLYTCLSVCPSTKFSGPFSTMCATIALKLCTWLYIYSWLTDQVRRWLLRIIDHCLEELCPWTNYQFSGLFFLSAYRYSFDIWYIALLYQDTNQVWVLFWSIYFSRSQYDPGWWTQKNITNYQFRTFSFSHLQLFIWYLVYCFAILSSLSLVLIHWFSPWS
jgi:hypothetical protein